MPTSELQLFQEHQRSNWVRLRTLVTLRWFAIGGQAVAIFVAVRVYDLQIASGLAALVILVSIIANFASGYIYPTNKRLSEREAFLWLVFDILQLSLLLYLTGGLNNPFAMLVMAPVTIAATVLRLNSTIILGLLAIIMMSIISEYHLPIVTAEGITLDLPVLFQFGFWIALMIGVVFLAIYARQVTTEMHTMG
ncbi:MAG: sensor histidine kinase, partial [Pseudomonadota bacterium]